MQRMGIDIISSRQSIGVFIPFFILLAAGIYFLYLLQQNAYPISRNIEAYNYDSCLTLKQENNSVTFTY